MVTKTLKSKGFLFDLDGTLIDTTPQVVRFWTNLGNEYGIDPAKILATSHGRRGIETLQMWIPELATVEKVNEMEAKLAQETEGVIILPGVRDMIDSIDLKDWNINTAGINITATTRLGQFNLPIPEKMCTGDMLENGKPHPEGYLRAASYIDKDPRDCIVFEDAPAGVQAAIAAGSQCIACTTTHTVQQLKDAGATVIVDRFDTVRIKKLEDGSYETVIENAYDF